MAQEISMPNFGGLMRYKEEYDSKLKISPMQVIILVLVIIFFVYSLRWFFPIAQLLKLLI